MANKKRYTMIGGVKYYIDDDENITTSDYESSNDTNFTKIGGYKYYTNGNVEKMETSNKESDDSGWFKSSNAFDDGWQFGDITKTVLGSVADAGANVLKGATGIVEGATDLVQYGAAGVASLVGADNTAERWKESAQYNWSNDLYNPILEVTDRNSVFGDKSDSIAEGVGHYGGMVALQSVGVPWQLTSGVTSMSGGLTEAFESGASVEDAIKYSLLSAVAEIGSEYMFSGLGALKGTGDLSDAAIKKMTKGIKNSFAKNLTQFGLKSMGEGLEEIASGWANEIAKRHSYMKDEEKNVLENAWKGTKDYWTQQAAQDFWAGTLVSAISGVTIPGQGNLVNNLRTGRSVMNNLTANEQKVLDSVVETRYNEELKGKENLTDKQKNQLKKTIEEITMKDLVKGKVDVKDINNTIGEENVINKGRKKDSYLINSYNNEYQKTQEFKYEATDDAIANNIYEKAKAKGLDNTVQTHEVVELGIKVAKELNTNVDFTTTEEIASKLIAAKETQLGRKLTEAETNKLNKFAANQNGMKIKDNIILNIDSKQPAAYTIGHEVKHFLEGDKETNKALNEALIELAKLKKTYNEDLENLKVVYEGVENADVEGELMANYTAEFFTDENFVMNLSTKNPGLLQKLANFFKELYYKATNNQEKLLLKKINDNIQAAYSKTADSRKGLEVDRSYEVYEKAQNKADTETKAEDSINLPTAQETSQEQANKPEIKENLPVEEKRIEKLEKETKKIEKQTKKIEKNAKKIESTVEKLDKIVETLTEEAYAKSLEYAEKMKANLPTTEDTQYSLSAIDNQGRKLSKEQQEHFKDSKARDDNGNLITLYHGSNVTDTTIFKKDKFGNVGITFLTNDMDIADTYRNKQGRRYEFYADIKNPLVIDGEGKNWNDIIVGDNNAVDSKGKTTDQVVLEAYNSGKYDGVIFKNIIDRGTNYHKAIGERISDVYVVFNSNQIKNIDNLNPTDDADIRYSLSEGTSIEDKINSSMTMEDAKRMIQIAFQENNINDWRDDGEKYLNGDDWLNDVGTDEVASYVENTESTIRNYLNPLYEKDNSYGDEYYLESIIEAYQNGTLKGSAKPQAIRLDTSISNNYQDNRFYAPKEVQATLELYNKANQRVTNNNRNEVYKARADFIIATHQKGTAEQLGLTQQEVNKKIKSWANYPERAMKLSNSVNEGVATQNKWVGLENSSIVNTISISNEDLSKMVKEIKGDSGEWQRQYITSTMLALDTHIDYSKLTFEFDQHQALRESHALGDYSRKTKTIRIGDGYQNTVAHEIGHYIDNKWAEDFGFFDTANMTNGLNFEATTLPNEAKQFNKNFQLFMDDLVKSATLGYGSKTNYYQDRSEVFARFVGKFVEWTKNQATNNRYGYEDKFYTDNFTESQYKEFIKLLQEKSMLDTTYNESYSIGETNNSLLPTLDYSKSSDMKLVEENLPVAETTVEENTNQSEEDFNLRYNKQVLMMETKKKTFQDEYDNLKQDMIDVLNEIDNNIKDKQAEYNAKKKKDTKVAQNILQQIESLKSRRSNMELMYSNRMDKLNSRIENFDAKIEAQKVIRSEVVAENRELARTKLGNIFGIKDKSKGIKYQINTMKRNLRDIMSKEQAEDMYNTYFKPISEHNAAIEQEINSYNERIQKYALTNEESTYTQMIGEKKYNPECTLTDIEIENYYNQNRSKIDKAKCEKAVVEFRNIYDELIVRINDVLIQNGYKPIDYRKGYFPHFIEEKATSTIGKLAEKLGWKVKKGTLPTDIAGITDQFKPGKAWTSFSQQRTGDATDYNALKGLDNYLRGAMDVIHHTGDIQKLRALENEIRYQYSDKGIQEKIDNIYADEMLDIEEKNEAIANLTTSIKNSGGLGNFATELRNYTDNLANKKSIGDRGMEQSFGRDMYSIMQNINGRVSANMVGANISSALTNFIPITQAWSQVSTKNLMKGMYEAIRNTIKDDGFANNSTYLINRTQQAERLYQTKLDKINKKLGIPFEAIDSFTSNAIVRAKYYDNLEAGMTEAQAMDNANEFAKDVMAGRSKGDMPTIFNQKNPIMKLFTAFQLEVNNQYGYMFKDIPVDMGDEAKEKLIGAFIKMFLGAFLYNQIAEKVTGRKSAFSPIDMAIDDIKTMTNENMDIGEKLSAIVTDTAQELPFVGGVMGGGRLPIQGAIPYENPLEMITETLSDASKVFDGDEATKRTAINNLKKEWSKPLYYVAMPFAGGQIKKTVEGLSMYDSNLPIAGSYTSSGKLRFEADTSPLGKLQAAVFGQYASKNAREYFENGYTPLTENQVNEALETNMNISEYREYRNGLKKQETTEDKVNYIYNLPLDDEQKNILVNNALNRKDDIDISGYGEYGSLAEFDYANKNPEKHAAIMQITDFNSFVSYKEDIDEIKEQYDNVNARKNAVKKYINSLSLNQYQKLMLERLAGGYSIKNYKSQMQRYINSLELTKEEKEAIDSALFD